MCRNESLISRFRVLLSTMLLGLAATFVTAMLFVGMSSASAQGAVAATSPNPPCCKPGDPDCIPNEYADIRVALVIGVDEYGHPGPSPNRLTNLKNAKNDARALAGILSRPSGPYVVRCILDPDRETFVRELKKLKDHLTPFEDDSGRDLEDNSVIVHFSGHGFRDQSTDMILLSGDIPTKEQAVRAAVSVFQVSEALETLKRFDVYLIFDSCRNRSDANSLRPDWSNGFGKAEDYTTHGHTVVFSAGLNQLAFDRNEAIGAKDNGALIFTLSKYFKFPAMLLREIYETSIQDPSMQQIGQRPSVGVGRPFIFNDPWNPQQGPCSALEANVARRVIECRLSGGANCIGNKVCRGGELRKLDDVIRDEPVAKCTRDKLREAFSEIRTTCENLVATISSTPGPGAGMTSNQLHFDVLISESAKRISDDRALRDLFATADRAPTSQQRTFLNAQRRIVGADNPFSEQATAKLRVKDGPIELKLRPSGQAGTTGQLIPTGKTLVDCDAQPCTREWSFVRVPTAKGIVDGWLPTSRIELAPPSRSIMVEFADGDFAATRDSRKRLREFADEIRASATAEVTTIVSAEAPASERTLALTRLAYVQNMLAGVLKSQQVNSRVLPAPGIGSAGVVTVSLFKP
jgi:hypothetical protein